MSAGVSIATLMASAFSRVGGKSWRNRRGPGWSLSMRSPYDRSWTLLTSAGDRRGPS